MSSSSPYYTGDSVPVRLTLTDADGAVNPSSCSVVVLKPDNTETTSANATINANVVTYTIPGTVTTIRGHYKAYFVNTLSYGERTYKVEFDVVSNPEINR